MKELKFRPLRVVDGKVIVASYRAWRKVFTANREGAIIKMLPMPEFTGKEDVYRMSLDKEWWTVSRYEQLFWPNEAHFEERQRTHSDTSDWNPLGYYSTVHDCEGCPTFSHWTSYYIGTSLQRDISHFEPLTTKIVLDWYSRIFTQLDNLKWAHTG